MGGSRRVCQCGCWVWTEGDATLASLQQIIVDTWLHRSSQRVHLMQPMRQCQKARAASPVCARLINEA